MSNEATLSDYSGVTKVIPYTAKRERVGKDATSSNITVRRCRKLCSVRFVDSASARSAWRQS